MRNNRCSISSTQLIAALAFAAAFNAVRPRPATAADKQTGAARPRPTIVIGFTSFRDDNRYANVFRYELSPTGEGKLTGKVTPGSKRSDHHLSLSSDGKRGVFAGEVVGLVNQIYLWDFVKEQSLALPSLNIKTTAQMAPSFVSHTPSAGLIAFEAWKRPTGFGRWDVLLYDISSKSFVEVTGLNTAKFDERKPAISADEKWIAFTTNRTTQKSLTDIHLYDRRTSQVLDLPGLNTASMDTEPALSHNGRLLAFISARDGGAGARDVYLYDRVQAKLLPLPGINSSGQEQSPSISSDGRFIAFVSERLVGSGERDIYLYDRETQKLVPTPDLNSAGDEYDPCVIVMD